MLITKIEPVTKTKYKVFVDEQFAFVLYKGELSKFHVKEGAEMEDAVFRMIRKDVILKRAKLRAMHLLTDMDRTESQLRTKLKQNLYPEDVIEQALQYVKSFGYVEDTGYARRFVAAKQGSKSKKEIYAALCQKGISKEIIEQVLEESSEDCGELEAIQRLLLKKKYDSETASREEKVKVCNYLLRKGFRYENIRQVLHVSECDT